MNARSVLWQFGPSSLLSDSQDRGHHARAAAAVEHRQNAQRRFVGRVRYDVVVQQGKAQRA